MNLYTTRIDCEVAGQWRAAGVPFSLTDGQAAELMPPRGNVVALYAPDCIQLEYGVPNTIKCSPDDPTFEIAVPDGTEFVKFDVEGNVSDDKEPANGRLNRRQRRNRKTAE